MAQQETGNPDSRVHGVTHPPVAQQQHIKLRWETTTHICYLTTVGLSPSLLRPTDITSGVRRISPVSHRACRTTGFTRLWL